MYAQNGKLCGKDIEAALDEGCPAAKAVMEDYTKVLAKGIDSLASIFDPDLFIISGGIANMGDYLLNPIKEKLKCDADVRISVLKNDAGAIGAAMLQ